MKRVVLLVVLLVAQLIVTPLLSAQSPDLKTRAQASLAQLSGTLLVRGLSNHLKREQLLQAMCMWEDQFSHGSTFALFAFVHQVLNIPGVTVGRNHLHASLLKNMMLTLEQLGPDPWREIQQFRTARN